MAFVLRKVIDLSSLSPEWKDCAIVFNSPNYAQIKDLTDATPGQDSIDTAVVLLKDLFVEGKGFNGSEIVAIESSDIASLPLPIINLCFTELSGAIDPKVNES